MKKCYIYTRVSTAAQTEGYSLEAQEQSLRSYAEYRELQIAGSYQDAGKSGKSIKGRPAFRQMMTDVMSQKDDISFVLVFKLSRFGRNAADILKSLQTLEDYGIDLVSVEESIDSSTQGGKLTLAILSAVAEMERENITVQFMSGKMQKALEGGYTGGPVPYGYRNVDHRLMQEPAEAQIVKEIFELYLQDDMTASSVADALNRRGYTRTKNESEKIPFTYDFVSRILDNPFYCGRVYYNRRTNRKNRNGKLIKPDPEDIISAKGCHDPIVTEELWDQAHAKRESIARKYKKKEENQHLHLLAGIVKCPICGKGLTGSTSRKKSIDGSRYYRSIHYYTCRYSTRQNGHRCSFKRGVNEEIVDGLLLEIMDRLQTYQEFKTELQRAFGDQNSLEEAEEKLQKFRQELRDAEIAKDRLGDKIDGLNPLGKDYDRKYAAATEKLDLLYDRIEDLEGQIAISKERVDVIRQKTDSSASVMTFLEHFKLMYEEMTDEERKEMYGSFIDSIELFPDERPDGKIIRSISFRFPMVFDGKPILKDQHKEDTISFTLDCSDIDIELPEKGNIVLKKQEDGSSKVIVRKGTYRAIKEFILDQHGVKVSTLYIAQIKRKYGLEIREAYNKPEQQKSRTPICPKSKELLIMEALKFFDLMDQDTEYREESV